MIWIIENLIVSTIGAFILVFLPKLLSLISGEDAIREKEE